MWHEGKLMSISKMFLHTTNKMLLTKPLAVEKSMHNLNLVNVGVMGHNSNDEEIKPNPSEVENTIGKDKPKLKRNPSRNRQTPLKFKDYKMN